jgi:1,4-alpha-glucan branching enzyme
MGLEMSAAGIELEGGHMTVKKNLSKTGRSARVTFTAPPVDNVDSVYLVGDFNEWDRSATPLQQRKDGRFSGTVSMEAGREYRFKYLVGDDQWINDDGADKYVPNDYGSDDSVIEV